MYLIEINIGRKAVTFCLAMSLFLMFSGRGQCAECIPRQKQRLCGLEATRCLATFCLSVEISTRTPGTGNFKKVSDDCCRNGCVPADAFPPFC